MAARKGAIEPARLRWRRSIHRSSHMPTDQSKPGDPIDLEAHVRRIVDEIETGGDPVVPGSVPAVPANSTAEGGIERAVRSILTEIGEDPGREGLLRTPERMHKMWLELTCGYRVDPERLINGAVFDVGYSEMVVVKGIPFYSLCEHHMLPFFGVAAVGYLPRGRVIGLSKIPRVVEMYARRLQVQERMTQQVADFLQERLNPYGVGVVIEAEHLCLAMRGVQKGGVTMVTSSVLGTFRSTKETRDEFMAHLERATPRV
jgi:GTP cyclohydrolase I